MAYQKIVVNTNLANVVNSSDNANIPMPSARVFAGTQINLAQRAVTNSTNTALLTNTLLDTAQTGANAFNAAYVGTNVMPIVAGVPLVNASFPASVQTAALAGTTGALATTSNNAASGTGMTVTVTALTNGGVVTMKVVAQGSGYVAGDTISCSKTLIDADGKIGAVSANVQATIAASGFLEVNTYQVYNETVAANAVIVGVDSGTNLSLDSDAFPTTGATGADYAIIRRDALVDKSVNFLDTDVYPGLEVGAIVKNNTSGQSAYVTSLNSQGSGGKVATSHQLTLSAEIFGTLTQVVAPYTIYANAANPKAKSSGLDSSECCLLYVGSNEATMTDATSFVDVRVLTCADNDVIFTNFRVGDYLPVQIKKVFRTNTSLAAQDNCIAIW
jgi:hypothetical protein|tara:strand:+ start:4637 stop:5800 length:1164 start_codon:yes stop_codon:yes gene_type:complete